MIEINLLPGAKRKRGGKRGALKLPDMTALLALGKDPWLVAAIASWVLVLGATAALYLPRQRQVRDLGPKLEQAVRDSGRYATILKTKARLQLQRDSLLWEIQVIRDIDRERYIWPHILDAVSKALPPYTWLDDLAAHTGEGEAGGAAFTLQGKSADPQAVSRFMRNLEESQFVEGVALVQQALVPEQGHDVTSFSLTARYEVPPMSILTMQPLAASVVQGIRSGGGAARR